jgi:hypothetical protein
MSLSGSEPLLDWAKPTVPALATMRSAAMAIDFKQLRAAIEDPTRGRPWENTHSLHGPL